MALEFVQPAAIVALSAILVYWTLERVLGGEDDPSIRQSVSTETGTASFLLSGTKAVGAVAMGILVLAWPSTSGSSRTVLVALLATIVVAHWFYEKEEREA